MSVKIFMNFKDLQMHEKRSNKLNSRKVRKEANKNNCIEQFQGIDCLKIHGK